jgi:hypothetical protein
MKQIMKHFSIYLALLLYTLTSTGCQSDSDYLIGKYVVITTVKLSSCPEEIFTFSDGMILPTGLLPGQTGVSRWKLQRVGVTGDGMDKMLLEVQPLESSAQSLEFSGLFDHGLVRVETQSPLQAGSCELHRFVIIYGMIEQGDFSGEIRTVFSNLRPTGACADLIPSFPSCEVHEEFAGRER